MVDFLVVGCGVAGLSVAGFLSEDYDVCVVERNPKEHIGGDLWAIIGERGYQRLQNLGAERLETPPVFFDEVRIYDSEGRQILEHQTSLVAIELRSLMRALIKCYDGFAIVDKTIANSYKIGRDGVIEKLSVCGKKHEVYAPAFVVDASGYSMFFARRKLQAENRLLFRHNVFDFFHAEFSDIYKPPDKEALHIMFSDWSTPGGISITFFQGDRAKICGFYNRYLSSLPTARRCNQIKNSLGFFARLLWARNRSIILSYPLFCPSYGNVFLVGAATLSVYPIFFSGISQNIGLMAKLPEKIAEVVERSTTVQETMFEYAKALIPMLYRGMLNDAIRILLVSMRSQDIERIADTVLEAMKILTRHEHVSEGDIFGVVLSLLQYDRLMHRLSDIAAMFVELYEVLRKPMGSLLDVNRLAKEFSKRYIKNVSEIVGDLLAEKIVVEDIIK